MSTNRWLTGLAAAAGTLGAAAVANRILANKAERDDPPLGAFLDVDGVRLHYVEHGSGPPIVLLHGSGSLVQDFLVSGLVDALAARHRVIAFDRPGYGYSTRPRGRDWSPEAQAKVFADACLNLGADRPVVVGHSWGTLPAVAWALDRPGQVAGLVLMSGYFYATPRIDALPAALLASPVLGDIYAATLAPLQTRLTGPLGLKMIFSPAEIPRRFMDEMPFGLMLRPSQLHATAADSGMMPVVAARLEARYRDLRLPIAVIWDDDDKLVDQSGQSARLAAATAGARAIRLPDAGHMLHHTHRDRVAAEIHELADRCRSAGS